MMAALAGAAKRQAISAKVIVSRGRLIRLPFAESIQRCDCISGKGKTSGCEYLLADRCSLRSDYKGLKNIRADVCRRCAGYSRAKSCCWSESPATVSVRPD